MSETTENQTAAEIPAYKSALLEDVEEAMRDVVDPSWASTSSTSGSSTASTSTRTTSRSST